MENYQEKKQKVKDALEHFDISNEETRNGIWIANNTEKMRKNWGIEGDLKVGDKEIKRARIIIDYEAGYPLIVKRTIIV